MTIDGELDRSGRAIRASIGIVGGPTAIDLRRRRRRGRAVGGVALLAIAVLGGAGLTTFRQGDPVPVDTIDESPAQTIPAGAGQTRVQTADGESLGVLAAGPSNDSDSVSDQVLHELLDYGPLASQLARQGVIGSRQARAALLSDAGLVIETTIRSGAMDAAREATRELPADGSAAALVSLDPRTGEIVALAGPASLLERQPHDAYLPIAMAAALVAGVGGDEEIAAPAQLTGGGPTPWTVRNLGGEDFGTLTLGEALARSATTPWATLVYEGRLNPEAVADMAKRLGIGLDPGLPIVQAIVLGVFEVTPIDLAGAYATFATAGRRVDLHAVRRVLSADGSILYDRDATAGPAAGESVLDPDVARQVRSAMEQAICCGTGIEAALPGGVAQFGKTGTAPSESDAWFAGSTPSLTTVVWVGRVDSAQPIPGLTGGGTPARIWRLFMERSMGQADRGDFPG
jgi:membrane peptidoglycan carboxypeptidase